MVVALRESAIYYRTAQKPRDRQRAGCVEKAQAVCREAARRSSWRRRHVRQRRSQTECAGFCGEHLSRGVRRAG